MITRSFRRAVSRVKNVGRRVARRATRDVGKFAANVGGKRFGAAAEGGMRNLGEPMAELALTSTFDVPFNAPRKGWDRFRGDQGLSGVWAGIKQDLSEKFGPRLPEGPADVEEQPTVSNAKSFGNVEYRSETVFGEADIPGAVQTDKYKV